MKRVWSLPNQSDWGGESGIRRVVEAYVKHLPAFGWEVVTSPNDLLDIVAVHAGLRAPVCHVAHCHGLYWTSDYHAAAWEWDANRRVVEMCRVARTVTVPSEWVAEAFRRDMHINPVVLGHGLDLKEWGEPSERHDGFILWNKNRAGDVCDPLPVGVLARAFPQNRFVTTFKPPGDFHNLKTIGTQDHATMMDVVKHAAVYLATTKETFGIGILEAMACFPAGTNVEAKEVLYSHERRYTGTIVSIKTKRTTIRTTAEHPFWTTQGWVHAKDLTRKHLLCYIGSYGRQEKVHSGAIEEVVAALQNPHSGRNCAYVGNDAKGDRGGSARSWGQQALWGHHQATSDQSFPKAVSIHRRHSGRGRDDNYQAQCQETEANRSDLQHIHGIDGLVAFGDSSTRCRFVRNDKPEIWPRSMLHIADCRPDESSVLQGTLASSGYQTAAHDLACGVGGIASPTMQERSILPAPPGDHETTEGYEYQAIEEIVLSEVTNLPIYDFTTASNTYLAEGYLVHNSGVPVLGYAHGGILEMVEHGINGYLARPKDEQDLIAGLAWCLKHRDSAGANGRTMVEQFTWERQVEKLAKVYDEASLVPLPKCAIVIPSYNYAGPLHTALRSACEQDYPLLTHIIVVDDGSPDGGATETVVRDWMTKDARIGYVRQENQGVAFARNHGIEVAWKADCKYVACLDADDWLDKRFISTCVNALEGDPSLGIAYTGLHFHKPDGSQGISPWPTKWDYNAQLQRRNQIPTACVFRTKMWRRLGGYRQRYAPLGAGAEDAEFWLRSGAYGFKAAKVSEEGLFHYSWMTGGVTGNKDYREVDWLAWHPWAGSKGDGKHPFASYAKPKSHSHPVRQYDEPLVTVVVPVGPGHQKYLWDALDSLEGQTFRRWEAVVVMDNKEDVEAKLLDAFPWVRWGRSGGKGAGAARNEGARLARGSFLLFLDADDYLLPLCIETMLEAWRVDNAIPYTDYLGKATIDDVSKLAKDLQARVYFHNPKTHEALIGYKAQDFDCEQALRQPEQPWPFIWCNVTCLVPKGWHEDVGGFDEAMSSWEDVEYHWRLARKGRCYVRIPEELMVYRFSTGTRRQEGLQHHQSIVEYIRRKWGSEEPVGCGCGGNGRSQVQRSQAENVPLILAVPRTPGGSAPMTDAEFVLAKYTHPNRGEHAVIGTSTRTKYGFRGGGEIFLVHKDDVEAQPHLFEVIDQKPTPVPEVPRVEPPAPEAVVHVVAAPKRKVKAKV